MEKFLGPLPQKSKFCRAWSGILRKACSVDGHVGAPVLPSRLGGITEDAKADLDLTVSIHYFLTEPHSDPQ
jgi:hypothetical protein